jgi:hypothetical protein
MAAGGAVAWASPLITSVASAQAVGSCIWTLDWDTLTTGTIFTGTTVGGVTVNVTTVVPPGTSVNASNRQVTAGPAGGLNQKYLRFDMDPDDQGDNQVVTISFSAPVTNLTFQLFDIDRLNNGWRDEIYVLTPGFTYTIPSGSEVVNGGFFNPTRFRSSEQTNYPNTSGAGNLLLHHTGPITSFQFRYQNGNETGGGNMFVGLGDITWTRC